MKKVAMLSMVLLLLVGIALSGCSNQSSENTGKVTVDFWHAMGGGPGEALAKIVEDFNNSQDEVHVNAIYQGSYEESLNKLRAVGGTETAPAIVQVYEIGTKYMSESGFVTPMQEFIDKDSFDISNLEENILSYYTLDGALYSMPFNTSNAIMFYNKDMFKKAGLDPDSPPKTFEELQEYAKKLTVKNGKTTETYGFSMLTHGWFFEQFLANQDAFYVDQENGRSGTPTKALINEQAGMNIFNLLNDANKAGTFKNFGREWDNVRAAFQSQQVAMYFDSTSAVRSTVENAPFEVGTAFMPAPESTGQNGVIVGGASLWMTNKVSEKHQDAAWEFIKYVTKPEVQAEWSASTGYFPIVPDAYDVDTLKAVQTKYPQFLTAVEQLQHSKKTKATQGALMGIFPEARNIVENAIEELYNDGNPQKALDEAARQITEALKD